MHRGELYCWLDLSGIKLFPVSEASASTMNCLLGYGWRRMGEEQNNVFNLLNAWFASGDHLNCILQEVSLVREAAILL